MNRYQFTLAAGLGGLLATGSGIAFASGFQLFEISPSGLGNAFAGGAAAAEDASTIFSNPAGMARLPGTQVVAGLHVIAPTTKFSNRGTVSSISGGPIDGDNGGNGGVTAVVPNLYVSHALNDTVSLGLGVNAPFGLATDYGRDWVGRYHADTTDLRTININPSVAFRLNDQFAIGVGYNALYADLREYSSALDSFGLCANAVGGVPAVVNAACAVGGGLTPNNVSQDSRVMLEGDDWGYGFNAGVLYQPSPTTRVGLHYRSKVKLTVEGRVNFTLNNALRSVPALAAAALPAVSTDTAKADVTLPEMVSLSSFQKINDSWDMMGDISWTRWSRFKTLQAVFTGNNALSSPGFTQPENWDDTYRFALGMNYHPAPQWNWRFGVAFDQGAVQRTVDRSPRIPDADRTWLALGVGYQPSDALSFALSYTHLFVADSKLRFSDPTFGHQLIGNVDSDVDILSAQATWAF